MDENILEQLCSNVLFDGLTKGQVADVLPCILYAVRDYGDSDRVCAEGEASLGVVLDGELAVRSGSRFGASVSIEKNGLLGEDLAFSSGSALVSPIIAEGSAKIVFLSPDFFYRQCSKDCGCKDAHREIVKNMLRVLSDKSIALGKKIKYLTAPDLKTKIAMYFCELCEATGSDTFTMPLNRDRLAAFFSVARPSLSRELISLKSRGVIDFHRSGVRILDVEALYAVARGE